MKTHTITSYSFDELTPEAKEKALDNLRTINVEHDWWDYIDEPAQLDDTGIKIDSRGMSFDIDRGSYIYFSPFRYTKKTAEGGEIKGEHKGIWIEDHKVLAQALYKDKVLTASQRDAVMDGDMELSIGVRHYGGGGGANTLVCDAVTDKGYDMIDEVDADGLQEWLLEHLDSILDGLRKEYEYQLSDEAIIETIGANEYDFTADGKLY